MAAGGSCRCTACQSVATAAGRRLRTQLARRIRRDAGAVQAWQVVRRRTARAVQFAMLPAAPTCILVVVQARS